MGNGEEFFALTNKTELKLRIENQSICGYSGLTFEGICEMIGVWIVKKMAALIER